MKKIFFFTAITFLTLGSCRKEAMKSSQDETVAQGQLLTNASSSAGVVSTPSNSGKPIPVTITMAITGGAFPTFTGPITTTGDIIPPGEGSMYVNSFGNVFHCIITLVNSEGTLKIREECNKTTFMGQWQIVEGTGAYVNLRGNGKVMMPRRFEVLEGTIHWVQSINNRLPVAKTKSSLRNYEFTSATILTS